MITGTVNTFCNYNMRVGDVDGIKASVGRFKQIALNAKTPEERERYANAAIEIKNDLLPRFQQDVEDLGKLLGLDNSKIGQILTEEDLEELEEKEGKKLTPKNILLEYLENENESFSYLSDYQPGMFFSKGT